ncbi:hypothetical protein NQ317_001581 [Molorchus minor]|uniref:Uncharacterized protein n=1 Tax=Molorchus minor TaxID=1323400 RepID=A0ABQ9J975_9CUCU|nr:hypothetical protein NQ317_001581 [Molorchus minor]
MFHPALHSFIKQTSDKKQITIGLHFNLPFSVLKIAGVTMNTFKNIRTFSIIVLILLLVMSPETEARRKVLKGRKTVTRWYMRQLAIPAWAIVTLVAIGQLLVGGLFYIILKICILDKPLPPRYQQVAPAVGP